MVTLNYARVQIFQLCKHHIMYKKLRTYTMIYGSHFTHSYILLNAGNYCDSEVLVFADTLSVQYFLWLWVHVITVER